MKMASQNRLISEIQEYDEEQARCCHLPHLHWRTPTILQFSFYVPEHPFFELTMRIPPDYPHGPISINIRPMPPALERFIIESHFVWSSPAFNSPNTSLLHRVLSIYSLLTDYSHQQKLQRYQLSEKLPEVKQMQQFLEHRRSISILGPYLQARYYKEMCQMVV